MCLLPQKQKNLNSILIYLNGEESQSVQLILTNMLQFAIANLNQQYPISTPEVFAAKQAQNVLNGDAH